MQRWMVGGLVAVVLVGAGIWYWTDIRSERRTRTSIASDCPDPLAIQTPVKLAQVESILYPGQTRGGDFKPHGGFRFADGTNAEVTVTAPLDADLVRGSRYIEQGETQYLLEFVNSCGIVYRFDHLLTLAPAMQAAVERFPAPQPDDSRTTDVQPPVAVVAGETIATAVGFATTGNASVDFGLYDQRQPNDASGLPTGDTEYAPYAVCWFDYLSASDEAIVRSLPPADATAGASSTYCK